MLSMVFQPSCGSRAAMYNEVIRKKMVVVVEKAIQKNDANGGHLKELI